MTHTIVSAAKEAETQIVFVIENGKVESTTLMAHVMASAEKGTNPDGAGLKLHIKEIGDGTHELRYWNGSKADVVSVHPSSEEANDEHFRRTYDYDFMTDDQRDTRFWMNLESAQESLNNEEK